MKLVKYTFFIIILSICFNNTGFSQAKVRIKKSQFIAKKEGAVEAWTAIKKGNKDYDFGKAAYRSARESYLKAYKYNDRNAELNYKIGICYLYSDDKFQAIKYLKKASEVNNIVSDDIHFQLARAYHMNLDFDNAIKEYKIFKSSMSERKLRKKGINIDKYISECETGKVLVSKPVRAVIQGLGKTVNSEYDDYGSVVDSKDEVLYFTSRRQTKTNNQRNALDKKFSEDIYVTKKKGKDWTTPQLLSKNLTTNSSEAILALSPDDKRIYIYKSNKNGDIFYSEQKDGKWIKPKGFSVVNSGNRETSISFSQDGKKLFFVSDIESRDAIGGKDIYYCSINAKGKWSKPLNMGGIINTPENEDAVYISKDGKTLYFSSKGHPGMGGYDIFSSTLEDNGKWSKPVNLGYPINTPDDDMYFSLAANGKAGYLSSNREQSVGERDIYKVIYLGVEKEFSIIPDRSPLAYEIFDTKSMFKRLPTAIAADSSVLITGKVLDSETKKGVMAKMQFVDSEKSQVAATFITDSTGSFKVKLPQKKTFGVEISAKGYLFFLDVVDFKAEKSDVINRDFILQELSVGAKVVLKNIFFDQGKSVLKEESNQQLTTVIGFMKDNPTLKLEISGHTDNVGSSYTNLKLSEARAKSVVAYMVKGGITQDRLTYKGYGSSQSIAPNNTSEGKALNRRVEFKITSK
jgi:outer membrane protein OmpA-like peptidoglycan-associated protein/tetratricopeptide (TPR) repeat protein